MCVSLPMCVCVCVCVHVCMYVCERNVVFKLAVLGVGPSSILITVIFTENYRLDRAAKVAH